MLYVLITCNIILSLFILTIIVRLLFNISFLSKLFDRIFHKIPLILIGVLLLIALIFSIVITNKIWEDKNCISVDAVVVNSKVEYEKIYYGDDEFGHPDTETKKKYIITFEFEHEGVHTTSHGHHHIKKLSELLKP